MWPAPRSTARRSSRATFHEEGNATMAKFGAGGGLFKLDAICDKLKTNLTSRQEAHGAVAPAANHVTENGVDGHAGDFRSSEEPNNNTDGLEKAVSLASHECSDYDEQNSSRQRQPVHDSAGDPDDQERVSPEARRKSRRKSCHPRNISNMTNKRQLAGYEVNNAGIDFGAICRSAMEDEEEEEEEADADDVGEWQDGQLRIFYRNDDPSIRSDSELSCASHEDGAVREPASVRASPDANSDVLDLSMSKPNGARPERDPERGHYADVSEENGVLNLSLGQRETPPSGSSGHASPAKGMKEYAEDTMNELLSMYGLTDDGGGSGTLEAANLNAEIFARKRHLVNSQNNSNDSSADSSLLEPTLNKRMKLELDEEDDNDLKRSPGRPANNRIGAPGCYAKAVGNQLLQDKSADHVLSPTSQTTPPDYCKYLKRFNSYEECRGNHCEDMGYKEHFHCLDCSFRVFVKKEEMIRHFKWHKKRDESLQHGFMRYSPVDDCSKKFPGSCTHNGKQTHYHCLQAGCSKVYISTSDVQMHANYHRKDSAILREGFQRFRATEDCGTPTCSFYNQRTTHFHCRRPGCTFTFKNKADMEKHKTYHQKDEILTKDGFKKFMKYEHCSFPGCRYSKTSNHIHCIRPGCHYVLHSTGQLYSHKRKHERANYDRAYRRLNMDSHSGRSLAVVSQHLLPSGASSQGMFTNTSTIKKEFADLKDPQAVGHSEIQDAADNSPATSEMSPGSQHNLSMTSLSSAASDPDGTAIVPSGGATVKMEPLDGGGAVLEHSKVPYSTIAKLVSKLNHHPPSDSMALPVQGQSGVGTAPPPLIGVVPGTPAPISVPGAGVRPPSPTTAVGPGGFVPKVSPPVNEKKERDESWKKFLTRYTANDPCHSRCQFLYKDHYHCNTPNCGLLFRSKDRVREHAKCHEQQERITSLTFMVYEENVSCSENCRYNHKEKHYHCLWADCKHVIGAVSDPVFSRMEHYKQHEHSRAAQGRRVSGSGPMLGTPHGLKRRRGRPPKYQKRELTQVPKIEMTDEEIAEQARRLGPDHCIASGFRRFTPSDPCPDDKCIFVGKEHYHCIRQRCHHATDSTELLSLHAKDFHSYIHILEGFEFFDRTVNCRRPHCHNNKATRHFHCVRPNCDYSFVRVSTMAQHDKKHRIAELGMTPSPTVAVPTMAFMTNHHQQQHGSGSIGNNGGGGGGGGATTPKAVPLVPISVTQAQQLVSIAPNAVVRATSAYFPSRTSAALSQSGAVKGAGLVHVSQTAPITVTMPLRQPVSSQAKVALSSVQPIVIAPITSCALPSTGLTSLVPAANPPGLIAVSSAAQPLLLKPLPTGQTEPVMTSAAVSASKTAENGSQIGAQLITIAPKPSPAAGDADVPDKKAAGTAASSQQGMPLTLLLQQKVPKVIAQTSWVSLLLKMQCSPHLNCGRPFCKLKKKDHFHCFDCNQAFSDPLRLKNHITKHGFHVDKSDMLQGRVVPLPDQLTAASVTQEENVDSSASVSEVEENGGSLNLVPGSFSNLLSTGLDQDNESDMAMDLSMSSSARPRSPCPSAKPPPKPLAPEIEQNPAEPVGPESVRPEILQTLGLVKRADEGNDPTVPSKRKDDQAKNGGIGKPAPELPDQASSAEPANPRPAASSPRPSGPAPTTAAPVAPPAGEPVTSVAAACPAPAKAEPAAPAYKKYTYNEDCQFERCAYRQSQSHYHCGQNNCGYAFCDLARFGPHSERHRRLLQLMGDEFEEYRANVDCGRADCEFSKKSSHFHCLRCPFICTDTVKVTVHRKNHAISEAPSD